MNVSNAIYNGLSDLLSAAIDTGNIDEVALVLQDIDDCLRSGQITDQQAGDLLADAKDAGYDL